MHANARQIVRVTFLSLLSAAFCCAAESPDLLDRRIVTATPQTHEKINPLLDELRAQTTAVPGSTP